MFAAVLGRTLRLMRRTWLRVLAVQLVVLPVMVLLLAAISIASGELLGASLQGALDGDLAGANLGRILSMGVPLGLLALLIVGWAQLAPIRAASGEHGIRSAMSGAAQGAPRYVALVLLGIAISILFQRSETLLLLLSLLILVPTMLAVGTIAREPHRLGLDVAWRHGLRQPHRTIGALLAVLVMLALMTALSVALVLLPVIAVAGSPDELWTGSVGFDIASATVFASLAGILLAALPWLVLQPALVVAVHGVITGTSDIIDWSNGAGGVATVVTSELSVPVARLIGAQADGTARPQPRMTIPPRATEPGRVPGPGVDEVAGVSLPRGRATRPVVATSMEFAIGDGTAAGAGDEPQLWVTSDVLAGPAGAWKRLATGFGESGLWPLLLPAGVRLDPPVDGEWYQHPARRELPHVSSEAIAERLRVRLNESLAGGSPLTSTDLFAASAIARGELTSGSGRRPDSLAATLAAVGPARLALVPVRRPADAIDVLVWPGASDAGIPPDELTELLASWEQRWGVLLVALQECSMLLAVMRPPTTLDEALEAAAEQHALCPDEAGDWGDDSGAAQQFLNAPTWQLSWH
jgi:hypothetical protein